MRKTSHGREHAYGYDGFRVRTRSAGGGEQIWFTEGITEKDGVRQHYVNQVPMKRGCSYQDVCNVVVFLASDQSAYMTGQAINVTGGQQLQ